MKYKWDLQKYAVSTWRHQSTIIEFNGPQLEVVRLVDMGQDYLSVACDEDESGRVTRWIRAPVSIHELEALLSGATTVLECCRKPELRVVDTDDDENVLLESKVSFDELVKDVLPSQNSRLPREITELNRKPVAQPEFIIDGIGIGHGEVPIRILADLLNPLQRLWDAIGQVRFGRKTTNKGRVQEDITQRTRLSAVAIIPGSFGLTMSVADKKVFEDVAEVFRGLLQLTSEPRNTPDLASLGPRVRTVFGEFVSTLQRHGVEFSAKWGRNRAFLNQYSARVLLKTLKFTKTSDYVIEKHFGTFVGYHSEDLRFEFYSIDRDEMIDGVVLPTIPKSHPDVTVGANALYEVVVARGVLEAPGASKTVSFLMAITPVAIDSAPEPPGSIE